MSKVVSAPQGTPERSRRRVGEVAEEGPPRGATGQMPARRAALNGAVTAR